MQKNVLVIFKNIHIYYKKIKGIRMDITTIVYNQFRENFNTINSHYLSFKKNVFSKLCRRN